MASAKQLLLKNPPSGTPVPQLGQSDSTFELRTTQLPELQDGQVLVQTEYLSNDPAQRGWISKGAKADRLYVPPVREGEVMRSFSVGKVLKSKSAALSEGAWVSGTMGWSDLLVTDDKSVRAVPEIPGQSMSIYVGALGGPGLTAYFSLKETLGFKEGETIVVSGAAGATGSVVVQLAKHHFKAAKVVGIAGSAEKCAWLKELGADAAINYKDKSFKQDLEAATDGYVDCFWDGVGGSVLNAMLPRIKRYGRVAAVGAISAYNDPTQSVLPNYFEIISNRITIKGMIVIDYLDRAGEAIGVLSKLLKEGHLKMENAESVVKASMEEVPEVWMRLFSGGNQGKLVTHLVGQSKL